MAVVGLAVALQEEAPAVMGLLEVEGVKERNVPRHHLSEHLHPYSESETVLPRA